ncbi:MAG: GntR family transcriptional regulator [Bryobacteraceae bacterium]
MATRNAFQFQLDLGTGVPAYRQVIDQVMLGISTGTLKPGDQLPTVRQLAVDLSINPNTVVRAYRELEIRGVLCTQQGIGTFINRTQVRPDEALRQKRLSQIVGEFVAKASHDGFSLEELIERLRELGSENKS